MRFEIRVTRELVNAEVERRIVARYDRDTQFNAMRGADDVDFDWIERVRVAGRKLKAMPVIPTDFAADHHWPRGEGQSIADMETMDEKGDYPNG
jgi:hypothetical protein